MASFVKFCNILNLLFQVEDVIHSTWAVVCDSFNSSDLAYNDHLMFSFGNSQKFWEPAFVEIRYGLKIVIREVLQTISVYRSHTHWPRPQAKSRHQLAYYVGISRRGFHVE